MNENRKCFRFLKIVYSNFKKKHISVQKNVSQHSSSNIYLAIVLSSSLNFFESALSKCHSFNIYL